ncbi:MAG: hypothetical protein U5R49_16175 [Deltaproteobacteria bacterium]|nr:hypothetical protein [Deltaproteobacteria bacterium]
MSVENAQDWEKRLARKAFAVSLVRDRLGCGCPEEVFNNYRVNQHEVASIPLTQLIMGDRLLVWIVDGERMANPTSNGPDLIRKGRDERERRGLNRFRLVWVAHALDPSLASHLIRTADRLGPRVHFHHLRVL